jgi:hypothetical protein
MTRLEPGWEDLRPFAAMRIRERRYHHGVAYTRGTNPPPRELL